MNDLTEQGWAWKFVNGFDMPAMDQIRRTEWQRIISTLTQEQFQRGIKSSRERPAEQLPYRPSVETFKGYALAGEPAARPRDTFRHLDRVDNTALDPRTHPAIIKAREDLARAAAKAAG